MIFLPYKLDVIEEEWPIANIGLAVFIAVMFVLTHYSQLLDSVIGNFILEGWDVLGLFGHMFLHANTAHLLGNLIFLWIFGNAICSKIGNIWYIFLFVLLGLIAAASHNIFSSGTAVGASGAIYGIIGFYLALHPKNKITCLWSFIIRSGSVDVPAYLVIGFWFFKDVYGLFGDESNIAHIAHIGGLIVGLVLSYWLVASRRIVMYDYDLKTLPELISKN